MGGASVNSSFQMQSSSLNLSHLFNNSSAFGSGNGKAGVGRKNIDYLKTLKNPASKAYATVVKKKEPRSTSSSGPRPQQQHLKNNSSNPQHESADLFFNLDLSNAGNTAHLLEILKQVEANRADQVDNRGMLRIGLDPSGASKSRLERSLEHGAGYVSLSRLCYQLKYNFGL